MRSRGEKESMKKFGPQFYEGRGIEGKTSMAGSKEVDLKLPYRELYREGKNLSKGRGEKKVMETIEK